MGVPIGLFFPDLLVARLVVTEVGEGGPDIAFLEVAGVFALAKGVLEEIAVLNFAEDIEADVFIIDIESGVVDAGRLEALSAGQFIVEGSRTRLGSPQPLLSLKAPIP